MQSLCLDYVQSTCPEAGVKEDTVSSPSGRESFGNQLSPGSKTCPKMCEGWTPCLAVCWVVSFFPKQKVQQVGRTWEMMLMAFSLSVQVAAALILVYLNLEEARNRDSSPGNLSSCDTDVVIPWPALCHGGPARMVLNTDPTAFPVHLCFPRALFASPPLNLLLLDQKHYEEGTSFPSACTELPISPILVLFH